MSDSEAARPELPLGWLPILRAIADAPQWWVTRVDLAERLDLARRDGRPSAVLVERLDAMLAAKWLDPWEHERRAAVTFSTLAAARLGCRLTQPDDPAKEPRWTDTRAVRWPRANAQRDFSPLDLLVANAIFDPQPTPDVQAAEAEEFRREAAEAVRELLAGDRSRFDRLLNSRPRILLTGCKLIWHEQTIKAGHQFKPRPACSTCHNLPLTDSTICLECFAWCLDEYYRWKGAAAA